MRKKFRKLVITIVAICCLQMPSQRYPRVQHRMWHPLAFVANKLTNNMGFCFACNDLYKQYFKFESITNIEANLLINCC